jgi:hypothetical protein
VKAERRRHAHGDRAFAGGRGPVDSDDWGHHWAQTALAGALIARCGRRP